MAYIVFVSYSTKDIPDVNAVRNFLNLPDVQCFVSEFAVQAVAPLTPTIETAIRGCDLFVVLWSRNAASSAWVPQEIGIAHGCKKPILPFVLEKEFPTGGFIKDLRYVAAYENPQQAMYTLSETVLNNSLLKKNQQNILGAIAIGGLILLLLKGSK
jgi:hypothetical protein